MATSSSVWATVSTLSLIAEGMNLDHLSTALASSELGRLVVTTLEDALNKLGIHLDWMMPRIVDLKWEWECPNIGSIYI